MPTSRLARGGACALLASLVSGPSHASHAARARPALAVLVVVDQMRGDYLDRFGPQLTGGLGRLARTGTVFTDARQEHAITETAPGHATLLSGRPPASTGIISNNRGVPDSAAPLVEGPAGWGASPARFRGTTLADWMLAADPGTRILSVSRKDRGAILPVGRVRGDVYWYAEGRFTTSRWYRAGLPDWLRAWNAREGAARLAGTSWTLLRDAGAYPEPDDAPWENGTAEKTFPHPLPTDTLEAVRRLAQYPWMDSLTLDVALEGVSQMDLGRRDAPDLLVVSLSTTDAVGHAFGPDSRELHDQVLRLDHWLGWFLDSLATLVPADRTVLALAADHGVQPFPERTGRGGRASAWPLVRAVRERLDDRYDSRFDVDFDSGLLLADVAALRARGVDVDSLAEATARELGGRPGVRRVFTPARLARAPKDDAEARLWRRLIPPAQGWLAAASLAPGWIWAENGGWATHGTTNYDDRHITLLFAGAGIPARRVTRPVTSEDVGPTLAALLGVRPTEPVTGRVLPEVAGGRAR